MKQTEARTWAVWGRGQWTKRHLVVADDADFRPITPEMPEFALLDKLFVEQWSEDLGSDHWAELLDADEETMFEATSFEDNVFRYVEVVSG